MELQGLGSINLPLKNQSIQPGQRFLIEVIHRDPSGKAQIRIGGQVIPALLETSAQPGEKFLATVQRIDASGIVLARDKSIIGDKAALLDPQGIERLYIEFGQNKENSLSNLLRQILSDGKATPVPGDGKGTPVPSDGKGTPVPSDGKGTPVPSDGKGTPVPGDGKGTPVPSDGKGALVPSDGKGTSVPSDGKGTPVPSDGKGAPVPSDGKGTPVPSDGKGTPVPSDGKGTPVPGDGKGTPVPGDGKGTPVSSDGKGMPVPSDGKGALVPNDGKGTLVPSDGKGASVPSDGKGTPVPSDGKGAPVPSDGKGTPVPSDGKGTPVPSDGKGTLVPGDGKGTPVPLDGKGTPAPSDGKSTPIPSDGKGASVANDGKSTPVPNDGKSSPVLNEAKVVQLSEGKNLNAPGGVQNDSDAERIGLTSKELIASFVNNTVPQWSSLSKDGFMQLFLLFRGLGLDYERRLKNLDSSKDPEKSNLQAELKRSLKGILLSLLTRGGANGDEKSLATNLLERLTGQQILLQGGNSEAPFYLMEIPLQAEGELYNQTLAIKASRKGNKLDLDHCRLALHAETPTLGELGLEGWIYEAQLTLKVFSDNPERLQSLVEENFAHTREIFNQMGMSLHPITVGQLETADEFHRFLKGELREGVDYQV
ncbi:hypothetical protein [Desulfitobacterium chlororespirans]|uniref:Hook-length control protein FliK n=1 Tax=Desulfitobacterium chlororespirans DSM 11544 TaxID=1121395 RepID=A0A1M7UHF9_9FIRM|nr:hypothetical protein [Desulfitobacterium chlororespirans]SHN82345.1 hypothetical protein SAMN02745215_03798 [Desulfitobacterium chlororespirans DSM 11544]